MTVENELSEAESRARNRKGKVRESVVKAARLRVLQKYGIGAEQPRQFADPAATM